MMMASAEPPSSSSLLPLLDSLEDGSAAQSEQTDTYLTIANRLSGEEGRQFLPAVEKHFTRLSKSVLVHISSPDAELSQAALQALGFCLYHSHVVSSLSETFAAEILSALCSLVVKSTDKNTCTRALWVISKQSFPAEVVGTKVSSVLAALESVWSREDVQSVVMEHEALNVIIRMLEQVPAQMGDGALRWAKLVIPLVVHSASKVRLRAAAALETGMPLLLEKQMQVAGVLEPMMSTKLIPELQKLFKSKNEANVLKLWPLFVKLLGKLLHRGGPFINSLLHLEELGFRSSSPTIKKIAYIAWKSLIDNFALNPAILSSAKRVKLLMQPLASINVKTEALLLTKVEVWWYLVVQLGPNLSSNFDQVSVPLLKCTMGSDSSVPVTPSRAAGLNGAVTSDTPKAGAGAAGFNSPANKSWMSLNSSVQVGTTFLSIQLLGLEMLLHYFLGPDVVSTAAKNKLVLSLEPLNHPLLSGSSSFTKHAAVLTANVRDGFINVGRDAPDSLLSVIWTSLVRSVNVTIETGSKKDRQGSEVLTLMLQALQSIVASEALPADKVLTLLEATVSGVPPRVLGSASYQVGKMDVLNGTPALFLILLLYNSSVLSAYIQDERFFQCLHTLVGCGLSGPTSPLAFAEAVLGAIRRSAGSVQNKEQLWRMWSVVVSPLTDTITQSNEVNQGDALEHDFSAVHSALVFPITHLLQDAPLPQAAQKSMLCSWSKLYKVFARCSALVVTAEENICCEELCAKMAAALDRDALKVPWTVSAVSSVLQVMVECVDFSPYTPQFQQKLKSPHTPVNWMKKRNKVLGNLSTFQFLLLQCLEVFLQEPEACSEATGLALVSVLSSLFTNFALASTVKEALTSLVPPLAVFCSRAAGEPPSFSSQLLGKLEKLLCEVLGCLQSRSTLAFDDELLALLSPLLCAAFPHKNKQLRSATASFWNATFGNSVSLTYPEEIRPILSQVKQKTPIILPGFELLCVSDELSVQDSSESSQMETKLSGMQVSSVGKRDSLLGRSAELQDRGATKTSKPVSMKLDFGSPKPPRRNVLEEEASIDFVFIPPETKERVLTEHQKEVKRTKRVDIPAMYNNLDASLDTTVFTQYTQSQEESQDKLAAERADEVPAEVPAEAPGEVPQDAVETEDVTGVVTEETQDYASPKAPEDTPENPEQEEAIPESADVSVEDEAKSDDAAEDLDVQSKDGTSPDVSGTSDLVSGTPQKPNSRRQSFITLETYAEGKPASPSTFTGPLIKTSNSQERSKSNRKSSSRASRASTGPDSQESSQKEETNSPYPVSNALESPVRPKDSGIKSGPVKLIDRLPSDPTEDEDVIPDTQTEVEDKEGTQIVSPSQDLEEKSKSVKRRRSGEEPKSDSPTSSRPNTRGQQAAQEGSDRDRRLRTRAQREKSESSQTGSQGRAHKKIRLYRDSDNFLDKPEPRRRRTREFEASQSDSQSDYESQSQGRQRRRSKTSLDTTEEGGSKKKVSPDKGESSQTAANEVELEEQTEKDDEREKESEIIPPSPQTGTSQESEGVEQAEKDGDQVQDTQMVPASSQTGDQPPEGELTEKTNKENTDSQINTSLTSATKESVNESEVKDKLKSSAGTDEDLGQEDSQGITPSSSDSQSLRRSRRSKVLSDAAESQDNSENKDSSEKPRGPGRPRRSKVHEEPSKSRPDSTPESSQSLDTSGSTESSQGRGRYSRRKSSPALVPSVETSGSESSDAKENPPVPRKRGRPRRSLPSPLTLAPAESQRKDVIVKDDSDAPQKVDSKTTEAENDSQGSESLEVPGDAEEQRAAESPMEVEVEVEVDAAVEKPEADDLEDDSLSGSPQKQQTQKESDIGNPSSQESGSGDLPPAEELESAAIRTEPTQEEVPADEATERRQGIESSEDAVEEGTESGDGAAQKQDDSDLDHQELPAEDRPSTCAPESPRVPDESSKEQEPSSSDNEGESTNQHMEANDIGPLQECDPDGSTQTLEHHDGDQTADDDAAALADVCDASVPSESREEEVFLDSPAKQKDLEALIGAEVGQSPSGGRTRGTWSPSASPSTSILKKGLKRPQEEDSPSPFAKSRRVSFANPIQHQEVADDIDRRSSAVRSSSPRRSKGSGIPQPKYVTTPTKGMVILSPRNLHSPGYKSSKKCLISEMIQEPRLGPSPGPSDCIYPALVGCSAPVEAVLPQISSNMWCRGFGQLVRARNIRTVGDLSALSPSEVKTLPIRSPKISNVKKALRSYEQQRKGRGGDELKSLDDLEMAASGLEDAAAAGQRDEDDKTSAETLATALVDEPVPADVGPEHDGPGNETPDTPAAPGGRRPEAALLSEVEALSCSMSPAELGRCSPQQLAHVHEQLGGLMRRVVVELQTRLGP